MIGRNGRIGPRSGHAEQRVGDPHWNTATVTPSAPAKDSSDVTAAVSRMSSEWKSSMSARNPRPTTSRRNRAAPHEHSREVLGHRLRAADVDRRPGRRLDLLGRRRPDAVEQLRGLLGGRRRVELTMTDVTVPPEPKTALSARAGAACPTTGWSTPPPVSSPGPRSPWRGREVVGLRGLDGDEERPVGAGAEAREQVEATRSRILASGASSGSPSGSTGPARRARPRGPATAVRG